MTVVSRELRRQTAGVEVMVADMSRHGSRDVGFGRLGLGLRHECDVCRGGHGTPATGDANVSASTDSNQTVIVLTEQLAKVQLELKQATDQISANEVELKTCRYQRDEALAAAEQAVARARRAEATNRDQESGLAQVMETASVAARDIAARVAAEQAHRVSAVFMCFLLYTVQWRQR